MGLAQTLWSLSRSWLLHAGRNHSFSRLPTQVKKEMNVAESYRPGPVGFRDLVRQEGHEAGAPGLKHCLGGQ